VNFSLKQPDPFVVLVDRSLGKQIIAASLRDAGFQVEVHDDHFSPDARDEEWLADVGSKGWVILTKDKRIKYRALELAAAVAARAKVFSLTAGSVQGRDMADIFLKAMPRIKRYVAENNPPYIVRVSKGGMLSRVFP